MDLSAIPLGTGLPEPKAAAEMAAKAEQLATAFDALTANLNSSVEAARRKFSADAEGVVPQSGPAGAIANVMALVEQQIADKTAEYRRELVKATDANRLDQLQQAKRQADALNALVQVYPNPTTYLSGTTVGDPRRNDYNASLSTAGPAELQVYARRALAENNKALAAAVISRLDLLGKDQRPFKATEFAEKFVGAEHAQMAKAAAQANAAFQRMINANRALERGRTGHTDKIASGLRNKAHGRAATE